MISLGTFSIHELLQGSMRKTPQSMQQTGRQAFGLTEAIEAIEATEACPADTKNTRILKIRVLSIFTNIIEGRRL